MGPNSRLKYHCSKHSLIWKKSGNFFFHFEITSIYIMRIVQGHLTLHVVFCNGYRPVDSCLSAFLCPPSFHYYILPWNIKQKILWHSQTTSFGSQTVGKLLLLISMQFSFGMLNWQTDGVLLTMQNIDCSWDCLPTNVWICGGIIYWAYLITSNNLVANK